MQGEGTVMAGESASEWSERYHKLLAKAGVWHPNPPVYCPNCGAELGVAVAYPLLLGPIASAMARPMFNCESCDLSFREASVLPGPSKAVAP